MAFLDRAKNPYFDHGEAEFFLAERDGEPVGWVSAQSTTRWDEYQGGSDAMFGFFETEEDPEVPRALLEPPPTGCASAGRDAHVGPMDFTTNDESGILIEGYERRPMILEPWHPPYYRELLEAEGFGEDDGRAMWELQFGDLKEGKASTRRSTPPPRRRCGERRDRDPQHAQARNGGRGAALHGRLQRGLGRQLGLCPDHRWRTEFQAKNLKQVSTRTGPSSPRRTARRSAPRSPCPTSTRCWRS